MSAHDGTSLNARVGVLVRKGASNVELMLAFPDSPPMSVKVTAARWRKQYGTPADRKATNLMLAPHYRVSLAEEAEARGMVPQVLVKLIIEAAIRDDMIDALLDDKKYVRRA